MRILSSCSGVDSGRTRVLPEIAKRQKNGCTLGTMSGKASADYFLILHPVQYNNVRDDFYEQIFLLKQYENDVLHWFDHLCACFTFLPILILWKGLERNLLGNGKMHNVHCGFLVSFPQLFSTLLQKMLVVLRTSDNSSRGSTFSSVKFFMLFI